MLLTTYLLVIIPSFIMGFINASQGSKVTENLRAKISCAAIGLSIGAIIAVIIYLPLWHIIGIIFCHVFFSWLGDYIVQRILYR